VLVRPRERHSISKITLERATKGSHTVGRGTEPITDDGKRTATGNAIQETRGEDDAKKK